LTVTPAQSWLDNLGAFRVSLPALDHFPIGVWSKLVARHSRRPPRGIMAYGDAMGYLPFREAIAEYLGAVRGLRCHSSPATSSARGECCDHADGQQQKNEVAKCHWGYLLIGVES
jgi:DNA-binding transcriptional MocR family regulator